LSRTDKKKEIPVPRKGKTLLLLCERKGEKEKKGNEKAPL